MATQSVFQNVFCLSNNMFCVQANYQRDDDIVTFAVSAQTAGWVALGIGASMGNADVFVGWNTGPLSNRSSVISDRSSLFHRLPTVDPTSLLVLITNSSITSNFLTFASHKTRLTAQAKAKPLIQHIQPLQLWSQHPVHCWQKYLSVISVRFRLQIQMQVSFR
ncbi:hypothetical protein HK096_006266 [Nowakowskiella sp. JEL0078]|nr:hypothetical protein HK096_006266 [Nowakowskiella sp. JEL0078]